MIEDKPLKVAFALPTSLVDFLERYARRHEISPNEALVQLLESERYLVDQMDQGKNVLIEERDGSLRRLVPKSAASAA
jgi:hypothetical protein